MYIVADENISDVRAAFAPLGRIVVMPGRSISRGELAEADALLVRSVTPVNERLLSGTKVRFVGSATAGIDHIDTAYLESRGITFAHAPGSNARAVAEYVIAAILELALDRRLALNETTVGIVGVGHVGARVARLCAAMGMRVLLCDPPRAAVEPGADFVALPMLLQSSDVVTLHVPLIDAGPYATRGLVGDGFMSQLRPATALINTSRGDVCDEAALMRGRQSGHLGWLALDVWRGEPSPNPEFVRECDIATPHIAGYSLDGRLSGTHMVYQALCEWAGATPEWLPDPNYIKTGGDAAGCQDSMVSLRSVIRSVIDLPRATRDFKHSTAAGSAVERGRAFDAQRAAQSNRREFWAHKMTGSHDPSIADKLRRLGFG